MFSSSCFKQFEKNSAGAISKFCGLHVKLQRTTKPEEDDKKALEIGSDKKNLFNYNEFPNC